MIQKAIFEERQRLSQNWICSSVLIIICALNVVLLWNTLQISALAPFLIIFPLLYAPFLDTRITEKEITVKFFLLFSKHYSWEKISKAYVRQYKPIKEYGGWGCFKGRTNNIAFNVSGDMGLQLEFTNGKKLLIGTNKPDKLERALSQAGLLVG